MYKTRIKKWQIDKNQKAWEVAHMLKIKQERDALGKRSEFIVRGRKVDWRKIEMYLKRDPVLTRKLDTNRGMLDMVVGNASGIICRTPSPDPAVEFSIPLPPIASPENRLPEELARITRDYCAGALDQGIWIRMPDGSYGSHRGMQTGPTLRTWAQNMRAARQLISTGSVGEGFRRLGDSMDAMQDLIKDEDPSLLFHMLGNTMGMTPDSKDLGATICRHILALCNIVHGPQHPLTLMFDKIGALVKTETHFRSIPVPAMCLVDMFEAREGPTDLEVLDLIDRFTRLLRGPSQQQRDPDDKGPNLMEIIDQLEHSTDIHTAQRFQHAYLAYMSDLLTGNNRIGILEAKGGNKPTSQATVASQAPTQPNQVVIRFKTVKQAYVLKKDEEEADTPVKHEELDDGYADADHDPDDGIAKHEEHQSNSR